MVNKNNYYIMKKKDLDFGLEQEMKIKETIENFFNIKIKKSKNKFCKYDFKGKGIRIELKSRRINSDAYPTTLLCKTKIDYYNKIKDKKKFILIFNYLDKIKYIQFNDDLLNLPLKKTYVKRGEIVENIEIDINLLKDLSD
jgi:hypothetical protein